MGMEQAKKQYKCSPTGHLHRVSCFYRILYRPSYIFSIYKDRERGCAKVSKKEVLGIVLLVLSSLLVVTKTVYDSDLLLGDSTDAE